MTAKATSGPLPPFLNPFASDREKQPAKITSKKTSKKGSKVVAGVNTILQATKSGSLGHEQILIALEATAKAANGRSSPERKDNILKTASCDQVASRRVRRLSLPNNRADDAVPVSLHETNCSTAPELSPSSSAAPNPEQRLKTQLNLKIFMLKESILPKKNELELHAIELQKISADLSRLESRFSRRRTEIDMRIVNFEQLERALKDLSCSHSEEDEGLKKELTAKIISLKEEVYTKKKDAAELEARLKKLNKQAHKIDSKAAVLRSEIESVKAQCRRYQKNLAKLPYSGSPREQITPRNTTEQEERLKKLDDIQNSMKGEVSDLVLRELRSLEHFALRELRNALEVELRGSGDRSKNQYDALLEEQESAFCELIGKKSFDKWKEDNFPKQNAAPNP